MPDAPRRQPDEDAPPRPAPPPPSDQDRPTVPVPEVGAAGLTDPIERSITVRLFGSTEFFRLWAAQGVSSLGDWIGFLAIIVLAARIGGGASPEAAISLVMTARILPGFFLAPVAGVLVDRWDRKRVMVLCDVGRGAVFATLPFIGELWMLVAASLLLEILTLLWQPAKEATVPNIVPQRKLAAANSLTLAAVYGTLPLASALFAVLVTIAQRLGGIEGLEVLQIRDETVAIWFNVGTFWMAAFMVWTITLPRRTRRGTTGGVNLLATFHELKEGWQFIFVSPVVRSVLVGLGTGLMGGGMLVPLGPVFAEGVLGAGSAGFGVLITCLGAGTAAGVIGVSALQARLPKHRIFPWAAVAAGAALFVAAAASDLVVAGAMVIVLGVGAGTVYVLGLTILHESVDDELRGRIFAALFTLIRVCILIAFAAGPLLAGVLDGLSHRFLDRELDVGGLSIALPGVRLALWLAALIIMIAGLLAVAALKGRRNGNGHRDGDHGAASHPGPDAAPAGEG